jgi:hypothetical protein
MKCCVCGKEKEKFLENTDLCLDCSEELSESRRQSSVTGYAPKNLPQGKIYKKYSKGRHFVYKFMQGDEILYIGKTSSLAYRMCSHISKSPFNYLADRVELLEFGSEVDMGIWELYLINKYQPQFNKYIPKGSSCLELDESWEEESMITDILKQLTFVERYE